MPTITIQFEGLEFDTASDAIQHTQATADGCDRAIRIGGRNFAITAAEAERLAAAGVNFAHLVDHHGRIFTVPVN